MNILIPFIIIVIINKIINKIQIELKSLLNTTFNSKTIEEITCLSLKHVSKSFSYAYILAQLSIITSKFASFLHERCYSLCIVLQLAFFPLTNCFEGPSKLAVQVALPHCLLTDT